MHSHPLLFALLAALAIGCGARVRGNQEVREPAPWRTEQGKQETRLAMAQDLLDLGLASDALTLVQLVEEDRHRAPEIPLIRGHALYLQGLHSEAEALLQQAARELKKDARPHRVLGLVYADTQRPDEAIASFRQAVEHDASHAPSWNNLGFLLYANQQPEQAVEALQKAVALDSGTLRYHRNLGFALFQAGRADEALAAFRAADAPATAWYNLGVASELSGEDDAARERYAKALALDPDHDEASDAIARLDSRPLPEESP